MIELPDVDQGMPDIPASDILIELRDGNTVVGSTQVDFIRIGSFFQTASEAGFDISQDKAYTIFVKSKISLGRWFSGVNLIQGQTLDCTVTSDPACGELIDLRDIKILESGDSDGFNTSSGSYNKVDSADLQVLNQYFNQPAIDAAAGADFNLDGNVDISDLEILGKNYALVGD
ncbi:hypothetical protein A2963_02690 [Candidatus Roizmanbacteria bacterium RIFCSPLOWO2_01_FULL_40_13]|nr:MAG: hypothetical protein A2963_02690 [Candidatus Roizmanbacteria bacterium RIFCSPLOWO2_01_FULL_40_13]